VRRKYDLALSGSARCSRHISEAQAVWGVCVGGEFVCGVCVWGVYVRCVQGVCVLRGRGKGKESLMKGNAVK
jgi:hypothetical protein